MMNITKIRSTLTALRDNLIKSGCDTSDDRAALTAVINMLDTEKWPEHAKRLERFAETKQCDTVCGVEITTLAVALALVPTLEARVKVLTDALEGLLMAASNRDLVANWNPSIERARAALTGAKENEL